MSRQRSSVLVLGLALVFCAGCRASAGVGVDKAGEVGDDAGGSLGAGFESEGKTVIGYVIARDFSTLRATQNVFKLAGWHSRSSWTKLLYLAPEGKKVKKGAVVARFRFAHQKARFWVQTRIRRVVAAEKQSAIAQDKRLSELLAERGRRVLAASRARLDTLKGAAISKRQLSLYRIAHRQARFEVDAITQRVQAQRSLMAADKAYRQERVAREKALMRRYHGYKANYSLRAPHDGVVRHAYYRRRRRKVKKGDGMPAGLPVVHLGRDERLAVRFFVPEHRLRAVNLGDTVTVLGRAGKEYGAKVFRVERFPQEMGFLLQMNSEELPNAREKAFVVVAEVLGRAKLATGNEIRVRLSRPRSRAAPEKSAKEAGGAR